MVTVAEAFDDQPPRRTDTRFSRSSYRFMNDSDQYKLVLNGVVLIVPTRLFDGPLPCLSKAGFARRQIFSVDNKGCHMVDT